MWAKTPEGAWLLFAILRFFVGVGLTAAVTPSLTVVVELTPTRHRTIAMLGFVDPQSRGLPTSVALALS
jgi:MFS transporter, putative metabolite:H+ symporter